MIIRTMMVPAMSPPMIAAAIELNISSKSRGTIPSTVVREAIVTGLRRESDASISACWLSFPLCSCSRISSTSTMPFLSIIPTSPNTPTISGRSRGDLRGISGGAQGDLRGISGGAHPLETFLNFFNKKSCVFESLIQNIWIRY